MDSSSLEPQKALASAHSLRKLGMLFLRAFHEGPSQHTLFLQLWRSLTDSNLQNYKNLIF